MSMRRAIIILLLVAGVIGSIVLFLGCWSGPRPPVLVVTFQGHTNTQDGASAIALCVSNATSGVVDRQSNYDLVFRNQSGYSSTPANFAINRLLSAAEAETLVVPVPAGSGAWSVRLLYRRIPSRLEKTLIYLLHTADSWGLPVRLVVSIYPAESEWMER